MCVYERMCSVNNGYDYDGAANCKPRIYRQTE